MLTCVNAKGHLDTRAVSSLLKLYVALQDHCRTRAQLTTDCRRREQALRVQGRHARAWQGWRGQALPLGARRPQTPARPKRVVVRLVFC